MAVLFAPQWNPERTPTLAEARFVMTASSSAHHRHGTPSPATSTTAPD